MYLLNSKKINIDAPITITTDVPVDDGQGGFVMQPDDVQFPAGWFRDAGERARVGITQVPDPVRPDERFNTITENDDGTLIITPKDLTPIKPQYKDMIDQACGAKRAAAVSQGDYIGEEYRRAYEDALAYKTAGYAGGVPNSLKSWKDASGMTNKAAADNIIDTRDMYMALLDAVRAIRLSAKAAIDAASTPAQILTAIDAATAALDALP